MYHQEGTIVSPQPPTEGRCYLFSFPFWIFVDTASEPSVEEISRDGLVLRIYPPFRSGPANFTSMPHLDPHQIPFLPGKKPCKPVDIPPIAAIPQLASGNQTEPSLLLTWGINWGKRPRIFPMDSLRLDVFGACENLEAVIEHLLQLLRWRSRQWWIGRSIATLGGGFLRGELPVLSDGSLAELQGHGHTQGRTVNGDELPIDKHLWTSVIEDFRSGIEPPIYDILLLDAQYFASTRESRLSVLDAASACEQARDTTIERLWPSHGGQRKFHRDKVLKGDKLYNHLDRDLNNYIGRSYRSEHPSHFEKIKTLWIARHNVAHGGSGKYRQGGRTVQIDDKGALEFALAAEDCVRWLESL
jgi:hypothetical protein